MRRRRPTRKLSVPMLVRAACSANAPVQFLRKSTKRSVSIRSVAWELRRDPTYASVRLSLFWLANAPATVTWSNGWMTIIWGKSAVATVSFSSIVAHLFVDLLICRICYIFVASDYPPPPCDSFDGCRGGGECDTLWPNSRQILRDILTWVVHSQTNVWVAGSGTTKGTEHFVLGSLHPILQTFKFTRMIRSLFWPKDISAASVGNGATPCGGIRVRSR